MSKRELAKHLASIEVNNWIVNGDVSESRRTELVKSRARQYMEFRVAELQRLIDNITRR